MVGNGTRFATSSDGINWTASGTNGGIDSTAYCVAYANGLWVAGGSGSNTIATSTNGVTWTGQVSKTIITINVRGVAYGKDGSGNGLWVATGYSGSVLATSPDGIVWTNRITYNNIFNDQGRAATFGKDASGADLWVAFGGGSIKNVTATSRDGYNWIGATKTAFSTYAFGGVYVNGLWVAVGQGGNSIATSTDGVTWTGREPLSVFSNMAWGIAYGEFPVTKPAFVAVGTGTRQIISSVDGLTWTSYTFQPFSTAGYGVAWNGSQWVAVGSGGNTIAYSANGIHWTGINALTTDGRSIKWVNNKWYATGTSANTIVQSTNGITWTGVATSGNTFTTGFGFDYASSVTITKPRILALGTGGCDIYGSTDGNLWSGTFNVPFTTQCNAAAWNGSLWVAVGQGGNTIATSPDGLVWTGRGTSVFTTAGYTVTWTGSTWIAGGEGGNRIATSTDGTTWVGSNPTGVASTSVRGLSSYVATYTKPN
jgi:hypothetical protein